MSDLLSGIDSGRVSAFQAYSRLRSQGETRHYVGQTRTIFRGELEGVLESRSGLIMGDFVDQRFPFNRSCVAEPSTQSGSFFYDPFPV